MKDSLFFDFFVNKETNTITVKREFAAQIPVVWDAWTKPEILDRWWASKGWHSQTKSMEFKEGGVRHYVMRGPDSEEHWGIITYANIRIHISFSGTECFADEKAAINKEFPQSEYKIAFINKGDKTLIEYHTTYKNLDELEVSLQYGFEEGTIDAYERLDKILRELSA